MKTDFTNLMKQMGQANSWEEYLDGMKAYARDVERPLRINEVKYLIEARIRAFKRWINPKLLERINTVCFILGPYRNLTSLIASMVFLHPQAQVLNHSGEVLFGNKETNFFQEYSFEKFQKFLNLGLQLSESRIVRGFGGSILMSHAFKKHGIMQESYKSRFGRSRIKNDVRCLLVKESLHTGALLRLSKVNLNHIFQVNNKLKFIMPIRNPMDCAISNAGTRVAKYWFNGDVEPNLYTVLESIVREHAWFFNLRFKYPKRFFYFFQNDFNSDKCNELAQFLNLDHDSRWVNDCLNCYNLKSSYQYENVYVDHYIKCVNKYLSDFPVIKQKFLEFSEIANNKSEN